MDRAKGFGLLFILSALLLFEGWVGLDGVGSEGGDQLPLYSVWPQLCFLYNTKGAAFWASPARAVVDNTGLWDGVARSFGLLPFFFFFF